MVRHRKYARYAEGGAVHHSAAHSGSAPRSEPVELDTPKATIVAEKVSDDASDASKAFQAQIDALRKAETHVAQAAVQPQHNLTARQQAFLDANPEMLDEPDRLGRAILQAHTQGFEPDSHEFHAAVAANFRNHHLAVAAHNKALLEHQEGTPEYHRAASDHLDKFIADVNTPVPPKRKERVVDDDPVDSHRGRIVSAPVSRGEYGGGSYSERGSKVVMTPEMKEAARVSGISETDYATQVLRLRAEKAEGHHTGKP